MLKIGSGSDIMKMKGEREEKNINNFRILHILNQHRNLFILPLINIAFNEQAP